VADGGGVSGGGVGLGDGDGSTVGCAVGVGADVGTESSGEEGVPPQAAVNAMMADSSMIWAPAEDLIAASIVLTSYLDATKSTKVRMLRQPVDRLAPGSWTAC
jgi:hypothetical protein